jgi:hypothetical protein
MKETWDNPIAARAEICARAEDLIAYIYGEASHAEARDFEKHTEQCSSCHAELAAFGNVREAIGEWRQQALGKIVSPAFETKAAMLPASRSEVYTRRRSAFAALREFFALSPVWMRAATAVAALVFCALAAIAVAHFTQQPKTIVVERTVKSGYSEDELKAEVAKAIKKQNDEKASQTPAPSSQESTIAKNQPPMVTKPSRSFSQVALKGRHQITPRRINEPSTELVRADDYLPFTASKDEEKLPSLSDLVSEDN